MTSQKYTILYGRLSQDDGKAVESNSVTNQRLMLEKYALDNGFENVLFLADDGYTGTNFERPSWKQIEEMIKRGEVETLIVKDLSRLGREYLQVGYRGEQRFQSDTQLGKRASRKGFQQEGSCGEEAAGGTGRAARRTASLRLQKGGQREQGARPRRRSCGGGTKYLLSVRLRQWSQSDRPDSP